MPFWSVYLTHVLLGPNRPTGFIILDCAYYCANGRKIFERGNGLAYCNPYDPDTAAPVIYWHWLPWLLGAGMHGFLLVINPDDDAWEDYNYLSATYTSLTPLIGHPHLTPGYDELAAGIEAWRGGGGRCMPTRKWS